MNGNHVAPSAGNSSEHHGNADVSVVSSAAAESAPTPHGAQGALAGGFPSGFPSGHSGGLAPGFPSGYAGGFAGGLRESPLIQRGKSGRSSVRRALEEVLDDTESPRFQHNS